MTQDTRKDRRVKIVSLNVRYKSATVDEFIDNHALDVSRGGIYIKTNNPFSPGTLLKFEIRLVSDQAVITGVGRVVWKRDAVHGSQERPPGMGVKFIKVDDPSRALIDKLVNTRADAGKAFESEPEAKTAGAGAQKHIATPPTVHAATRVGTPLSPSMRKGTMVGLGATPGSGPSPRTQSGAAGATPAAAALAVGTPPLGSPSPGGGSSIGATVRPGSSDSLGATVRPVPDLSGASVRPDSDVLGATMRPGAPSSPPAYGGTGSEPPQQSSLSRGPSVPPRPGPTTGNMFPKRSTSSVPPKGEATVMKQAAELLEEALREAGGSMDDVGTNPLFSGGSGSSESLRERAAALAAELPKGAQAAPAADSTGPTVPSAPAADDEEANARAMVAAIAPGPTHRRRPDATASTERDGRGVAVAGGVARSGSLHAPVSERHGTAAVSGRKKGGGAVGWFLLAAAAIGAVAFVFREQIKATITAESMKSVTPPERAATAAAPPSSPPSAAEPIAPASAAASSEPAPSASGAATAAPEPSASATEVAVGAASAAASSTPSPRFAPATFPQRPAAMPPAAYAAARPRPVMTAAAPAAAPTSSPTNVEPAATPNAAAQPRESEPTAAPPAASAGPGATAPPTAATPGGGSAPSKSRSSSRSPDDNPY